MQGRGKGFDASHSHRLRTRITLEQTKGRWASRIGKHLGKLRKQDCEQGMNLVLVARNIVGELGMQSHQFAVGGNLFRWHIATSGFSTEQDPPDRGGIQVVGFRTQPSLFGKLMRLPRMRENAAATASLYAVPPWKKMTLPMRRPRTTRLR